MRYLKTGIIAFLFGLLGIGVGFGLYHLYQDHANLHLLIQIEGQRQLAAQKAQSQTQEITK